MIFVQTPHSFVTFAHVVSDCLLLGRTACPPACLCGSLGIGSLSDVRRVVVVVACECRWFYEPVGRSPMALRIASILILIWQTSFRFLETSERLLEGLSTQGSQEKGAVTTTVQPSMTSPCANKGIGKEINPQDHPPSL